MNVKRKQKRKKEREDAFLTSKAFYERMPRANKLNKRICLSHQCLTNFLVFNKANTLIKSFATKISSLR